MKYFSVLMALSLSACSSAPAKVEKPCILWKMETEVYYPNFGFMGLGGAYTAIAVMPAFRNVRVCEQRMEAAE